MYDPKESLAFYPMRENPRARIGNRDDAATNQRPGAASRPIGPATLTVPARLGSAAVRNGHADGRPDSTAHSTGVSAAIVLGGGCRLI